MAKDRFQQAMLIGIGIMVAIGFSGVFTYGPLVNSNSGNTNNNQNSETVEAELPSENFVQGEFNLSMNQQANLAVNEQVIFVNTLYDSNKSGYSELSSLPEEFNNTVYVNSVNLSDSTFAANLRAQPGSTLVIGDRPTRRRPFTLSLTETSYESIKSTICSSMNNINQKGFAATCYT